MSATPKESTLHGHSPGALRAKREDAGAHIVQRHLRESLIGVNLVQPMTLKVIDDRACNKGHIRPIAATDTFVLQAGHHRGNRLLTVGRPARKHDAVNKTTAVSKAQRVRVDR